MRPCRKFLRKVLHAFGWMLPLGICSACVIGDAIHASGAGAGLPPVNVVGTWEGIMVDASTPGESQPASRMYMLKQNGILVQGTFSANYPGRPPFKANVTGTYERGLLTVSHNDLKSPERKTVIQVAREFQVRHKDGGGFEMKSPKGTDPVEQYTLSATSRSPP